MSALLEQLPYNTSSFSRRFEIIRSFLMKVVSVVPIESLVYAIAVADDFEIALQCCRQLMSLNIIIGLPPSSVLCSSSYFALTQLLSDMDNDTAISGAKRTLISSCASSSISITESKKQGKKLHAKETLVISRQKRRREKYCFNQTSFVHKSIQGYVYDGDYVRQKFSNSRCGPEFKFLNSLMHQMHQMNQMKQVEAIICGINLDAAYPLNVSDLKSSSPLHSPLQILQDGRKKMKWLVQSSTKIDCSQSELSQNSKKLTELYNSKMLAIVNSIRNNEVEVCSLLLGAFMEEQIRVPLMKTTFDTARAIELATSAAAVGVWALFSLTKGDVQAIISAIPSRSLLVEVKDYIKGVFQ